MEKVIFRKEGNDIIAFLPETAANYGKIACLSMIGGHSEADIEYYRNTKPAKEEEYERTKRVMENAYGYVLRVMKRIQRKDLEKAWETAEC